MEEQCFHQTVQFAVVKIILKYFQKNVSYVVKEKKNMPEYITDDIGISSDDSDRRF